MDSDVKSVKVRDPFVVQCAGHNYRHNPQRYQSGPQTETVDPLDFPEDYDQCCQVWEVENPDVPGGLEYIRCKARVHNGMHGFLCKDHHDELTFQMKRRTINRLGPDRTGVDLAEIRDQLQREVDKARQYAYKIGHDVPILDYRTYSRWGWARIEEGFNHDRGHWSDRGSV